MKRGFGWIRTQPRAEVSARPPRLHKILAIKQTNVVDITTSLICGGKDLHPILLLPAGLLAKLEDAELEAIIAHELTHLRRCDNLTALLHMLVEALFWFHPFVWWIGLRLVDERERACDEQVVMLCSAPRVYAEGILKVCEFYLGSPLPCAAGVTGSNLNKRIEAIMTNRVAHKLDAPRKLLLAAAGIAAATGPIAFGLMNAPLSHAQSNAVRKQFEVASIKANNSGDPNSRAFIPPAGGRISATNVTLRQLLRVAYKVQDFQISRGPGWLDSAGFDIEAKAETDAPPADLQLMLQSLPEDRFKLVLHRDRKETPVYALVVSKNGPKLKASDPSKCMPPPAGLCGGFRAGYGSITGEQINMEQFSFRLSRSIGRTVVDKSGLTGIFDLMLEWQPDPDQVVISPGAPPVLAGPSLLTAIQDQLGLKLDSDKSFVDTLVIDRAEKPSEN